MKDVVEEVPLHLHDLQEMDWVQDLQFALIHKLLKLVEHKLLEFEYLD
jgi:hypothetical protein